MLSRTCHRRLIALADLSVRSCVISELILASGYRGAGL